MENLPTSRAAAYRVMKDIETYHKLADMKKQLYDVAHKRPDYQIMILKEAIPTLYCCVDLAKVLTE